MIRGWIDLVRLSKCRSPGGWQLTVMVGALMQVTLLTIRIRALVGLREPTNRAVTSHDSPPMQWSRLAAESGGHEYPEAGRLKREVEDLWLKARSALSDHFSYGPRT